MGFKSDMLVVLMTAHLVYMEGPMRLGWKFRYTPAAPAPEYCSYASAFWYYLSHRQCFNQFLGIILRVHYIMGSLYWGSDSALNVVGKWFGPFSWWTTVLIVLSGSYLASGFLTARDAVHGMTARIMVPQGILRYLGGLMEVIWYLQALQK
ncbi:hypothetical protein FLAG1_00804 [Fusarium langsethiae]|uniref:Uncharacterized protein n=1 Tax=Fusarium langsethiae TaxID=179993 RepID=A0A0M9F5G0_FUSLA|nr:hypothetical protein FLAG1_00804 [Fusarium langsethiae]GKT98028.1 unnamed protein product [Fusarium langsethiae]GKU11139.1 unnamed protein product [Fusarium langsethiae]